MCTLVIVLPLMLLNWWLIGWMTDYGDIGDSTVRYFWSMILLVSIEAPLVSVFLTPFLGQVMFQDQVEGEKLQSDATITDSS